MNFLNMDNYVVNYEICEYCSGELIQVDHKGFICNKCGDKNNF